MRCWLGVLALGALMLASPVFAEGEKISGLVWGDGYWFAEDGGAPDADNHAVGVMLAELLDLPHVAVVSGLEIADDGKCAKAERDIEGGKEQVELPLPAVITAQKGLNEPRYPSFRGIRQARSKPFTVWSVADLGLGAGEVGAAGAKLQVVEVTPPPERPAGRIVEGEPAEAAKEVARLLREEAKVI